MEPPRCRRSWPGERAGPLPSGRLLYAASPGAVESMTGARFVHDTLEELGWEVLIADAQKVKGWRRRRARPTRLTQTLGCGSRGAPTPSRRRLVTLGWHPHDVADMTLSRSTR